MEIQHFSHHHPLFLFGVEDEEEEEREEKGEEEEEEEEGEDMLHCVVCTLPVLGAPAYGCRECYFVIHKSCAELPRKIDHPFHPRHPLTLTQASYDDDSGSFNCDACGRSSRSFTYQCSDCSFDLDLSCASLTPNAAAAGHQSSINHRHFMTLCDVNSGFNHPCSGCLLRIENSVYVCLPCKLFLHKSCAELPQKILQDPFRHRHPLNLICGHDRRFLSCNACRKACSGLYYNCSICDYCLDVGCAIPESPVPVINTELHHHPLAFIDSTHPLFAPSTDPLAFVDDKGFWCAHCRYSFNIPFFCCVDCGGFNLHLHCIPTLPPTIKHHGHRHPLVLIHPGPIKSDEAQDNDIIHYCNSCEKERRWFDPCYSCQICPYVAHIDCVTSEVIPILAKNESLGEEGPKLPSISEVSGSAFVMVVFLLPFIHWVARAVRGTVFSSPLDKIVLLVFGFSFWPSFRNY